MIHEANDVQECGEHFPRVGYTTQPTTGRMKSTSADASESRQPGPGLALLSYSPETNKGRSCAVELNFTIGSEAAESEPIRISNFNPRLGLLAENQELEPVFFARFQPNLASRMLGLSFLAFGPFLHILEFWLQIAMKPKDFSWGNTSWEHFCNRLGAGSLSHWSLLRTIFGLKVAHRFSFDRVFLQGRHFCRLSVNMEILRDVSWEVGWGWVCSIESLVVCGVSWDVGTGWVGSHAWCNMASYSGKVQNRDGWDEKNRTWSL